MTLSADMIAAKPHRFALRFAPSLNPPSLHHRATSFTFPPPAAPRSRPSTPRLLITASVKKLRGRRRPLPRRDLSTSTGTEVEEEEEDVDIAVPTPALASKQPPPPPPAALVARKEEAKGGETPIRGLDVLKALQRAASKKESAGRKQRRHGGPRSKGGAAGDSEDDGGEVLPLYIKEDWGPRLDELEKQVQELLTQQH